jgi:hypothetical protein
MKLQRENAHIKRFLTFRFSLNHQDVNWHLLHFIISPSHSHSEISHMNGVDHTGPLNF